MSGLANRRVVDVQVAVDLADDDLARVQPDADLRENTLSLGRIRAVRNGNAVLLAHREVCDLPRSSPHRSHVSADWQSPLIERPSHPAVRQIYQKKVYSRGARKSCGHTFDTPNATEHDAQHEEAR